MGNFCFLTVTFKMQHSYIFSVFLSSLRSFTNGICMKIHSLVKCHYPFKPSWLSLNTLFNSEINHFIHSIITYIIRCFWQMTQLLFLSSSGHVDGLQRVKFHTDKVIFWSDWTLQPNCVSRNKRTIKVHCWNIVGFSCGLKLIWIVWLI